MNSYFVENGSYLKLKNMQVGYTFNAALLQKPVSKPRAVFVMANNLLLSQNIQGLDPELESAFSACRISRVL